MSPIWKPSLIGIGLLGTSFASTSNIISNYSVETLNRCNREICVHFTTQAAAPINKRVECIEINGTANFSLGFDQVRELSSWTAWIDDYSGESAGPSKYTGSLVEATVDKNGLAIIDISNVGALSNSWTVFPPSEGCKTINGTSCQTLSCSPPPEWTCPEANQVRNAYPSGVYSQPFLRPDQICISNCSLLNTDLACCKAPYDNAQTCPASNPALKNACPSSYSYAFDDKAATNTWSTDLTISPLISLHACT